MGGWAVGSPDGIGEGRLLVDGRGPGLNVQASAGRMLEMSTPSIARRLSMARIGWLMAEPLSRTMRQVSITG